MADDGLPGAGGPGTGDGDRTSPLVVELIARLAAPFDHYFRLRTCGFERVPEGPCLLVVNHSIAVPLEGALLYRAWYRHFPDRPIRWLAHRALFELPARALLAKAGALLADPEVALSALQRGQVVAVFPGGEVEACRPFRDWEKVTFAGRSGFVALARKAGVPIVPVAICGAHAMFVTLPGAQTAARMLGVDRALGLKAVPLTAGYAALAASLLLPPLWPVAPLAFLNAHTPLPARVEIEVLDPVVIDPAEDDAAAAERVRAAIQAAVTRLAAKRKTPWG